MRRIHSMELKGRGWGVAVKAVRKRTWIHSMELKDLLPSPTFTSHSLPGNPFNGIESLLSSLQLLPLDPPRIHSMELKDSQPTARVSWGLLRIHSMELKVAYTMQPAGAPPQLRIHSMELKDIVTPNTTVTITHESRIHSMELKGFFPPAPRSCENESENPFNGIESLTVRYPLNWTT